MDNRIIKGNKITVGGGLHARIAAKQMLSEIAPIDFSTFPNRLAILADFSGSMQDPIFGYSSKETFKSKLDCLKEAIQDFALRSDSTTTAIAVISFPKGFRIELTNDKTQIHLRMFAASTLGDTPMGQGLEDGLSISPTRCMLISDGEATDGDSSYRQADRYRERSIQCDCVHVGFSTSGEERLKKIAEVTGGLYLKFKDLPSFASSFHYLLPESREAIAGMLPFERQKLLGADESK